MGLDIGFPQTAKGKDARRAEEHERRRGRLGDGGGGIDETRPEGTNEGGAASGGAEGSHIKKNTAGCGDGRICPVNAQIDQGQLVIAGVGDQGEDRIVIGGVKDAISCS